MTSVNTEPVAPGAPTVGWHPDPRAEHQLRFFDGTAWTEHVTHFGPTPCPGCGAPTRN